MISNNVFLSASTIKKHLDDAISTVTSNIKYYCDTPTVDFTRKRKLSCANLMWFLINLSSKSISSELMDHYDHVDDMPSASAVTQQRKKLDPEALKRVLSLFTNSFDNYHTFKGYYLLACDGSDINISHNKNDKSTYHRNTTATKGYNQLHLNALYDIENGIYRDIIIDTATKTRECGALEDMIKIHNYPYNSIIIGDRGYEKYNLIATMIENNQKFIIRVKDIKSTGILSPLDLPDTSFDMTVSRTVTRVNNKMTTSNKAKYAILMNNSPFDYIDFDNEFYEMTFRVVRFKITDDTYECLITNMTEDEMKLEEFIDIYHRRWTIETSFKDLKYTIGLLYFHSANQELIRQEIYASIILFNYSKLIILNTPPKESGGKYTYKSNFKNAVTNIRRYLNGEIEEVELLIRIKKFLIPIRPGRKFERQVRPQTYKCAAYYVG